MWRLFQFVSLVLLSLLMLVILVLLLLAREPIPERITYGMSFNTLYARELGLDWQNVYDAFLDDLGVRKLRLAAHWPMVEPNQDEYNFDELDYQIKEAQLHDAEVILGVGRRLPRWPECHVPDWATGLSQQARQQAQLAYMRAVIKRYRDSEVVTHWQVENEPYLRAFAYEQCGELDEAFLEQEVSFVRELDPSRPILVTDSGNLGTWHEAYQLGDAFGTSVYVYFWNPELGQFRSLLPPWFYRVKENVMALHYGEHDTMLIELSAEPWLLEPIQTVPLSTQFARMDEAKFNEILQYGAATRLNPQYLWGGEWWYWLKETHNKPTLWNRGRSLF